MGPAVHLRVTPERVDMPADGKSVIPFRVELLNVEGKRVAGSRLVTVRIGRGIILEPDVDPTAARKEGRGQNRSYILRSAAFSASLSSNALL